MRYSRQREQIYEYVRGSRQHPTAQMVYDALKEAMPKLSLGTVYRDLNQLSDAGRLKKILFPDGSSRFDGTMQSHSHIVCLGCGRVSDVTVEGLSELERAIERDTAFRLNSYELVMHGVCADCRNKNEFN